MSRFDRDRRTMCRVCAIAVRGARHVAGVGRLPAAARVDDDGGRSKRDDERGRDEFDGRDGDGRADDGRADVDEWFEQR